MEIQSTYNDGKLTLILIGRVDASVAMDLQKKIKIILDECENLQSIVVDACKMTFISSMGLRAIFYLKKKYEDTIVVGASQEVYNVFSITGFDKLINVEKAIPCLNLNGCPLIPGRKDMYHLTDDTMLKLYPKGMTRRGVEEELAISKEIFVLGVPTAMAFETVMANDCYGLIYEKTAPMEISADDLGMMLRQLHEHKINPDSGFPSSHIKLKNHIRSLEPYLGSEAVEKLIQLLSLIPDGTSLIHGSLSLSCIMKQNDEPMFTDIGRAGYGNPVLDLASLYHSLTEEEQKKEFFDALLHAYYSSESEDTIKRTRENIRILAMMFEYTGLLRYEEPTDAEVSAAKARFNESIIGHWNEILSRLRFKMDFSEEIRRLEQKKFFLDSDVDIDWIAKELGTNRHYVSDYFNKVLHTSFNDYMNNLRLDFAVKLYREGRVPKSQVLYHAGFNNDHTFRRLFKLKFGCLPSEYLGKSGCLI